MGKWLLMDQWYEADSEERIILSEMVQKTVSSEDYKKIAEHQDVIAIDRGVVKISALASSVTPAGSQPFLDDSHESSGF